MSRMHTLNAWDSCPISCIPKRQTCFVECRWWGHFPAELSKARQIQARFLSPVTRHVGLKPWPCTAHSKTVSVSAETSLQSPLKVFKGHYQHIYLILGIKHYLCCVIKSWQHACGTPERKETWWILWRGNRTSLFIYLTPYHNMILENYI